MASVAFLLLLSSGALASVCNVRDFGAKGDGKSNDTEAFIKTFQACTEKGWRPLSYTTSPRVSLSLSVSSGGPSTVLVPAGSYSLWPLVLQERQCSDLLLNVTGSLLAPSDPIDYRWVKNESFLLFRGCQNLTVHGWGAGSVDGRGQEWWEHYEKLERPKLIIFDDSKDVVLRDIELVDSPMFHVVPDNCENVLIENVIITAPVDSPNTDGIDPSSSRHVVIRNCTISTGDDNVAVKPGCQDILVENCLFLTGHGCSIGSINTTGVRDVVMRSILFMGTENGARIKTWQGGSGVVENISFINLRMIGVDLPIKINMYYCPDGGCHNHSQGHTVA